MSQYTDEGVKTFPTASGTAYARYLRVQLTAGVLAICDATAKGLGVIRNAIPASGWGAGEPAAVLLYNKPGTLPMVAAGAIAAGAIVTAAAGGKVSTGGAVQIGRALDAASGDGSIIEVLPLNQVA